MLYPTESQRNRVNALLQEFKNENTSPEEGARRILELDPESAGSYCLLGNIALKAGDFVQAEEMYWKGVALRPLGPMLYVGLANVYQERRADKAAVHACWVLAFWAIVFGGEVPPDFNHPPGLDYDKDPESYFTSALKYEEVVDFDELPKDFRERLRPFWLLKVLARSTREGLTVETLEWNRREAAICIPLWLAVVRSWARKLGNVDFMVLLTVVALLGEFAGPEILEELWELSMVPNPPLFLHAHWAIHRMAVRFPEETMSSMRALLPDAPLSMRCGIVSQLGLLPEGTSVEREVMAAMQGFEGFARQDDAAYLLLTAADAVAGRHPTRAQELFAKYQRFLTKRGRTWVADQMDSDEGFASNLAQAEIADLDIEDVCLNRLLIEDCDEEDQEVRHFEGSGEIAEIEDEYEPEVVKPKLGRNDPCWCGSGKKYKKCHLDADEAAAREPVEEEASQHGDPLRAEAISEVLDTAGRLHKGYDMKQASLQYFADDVHNLDKMQDGSEAFLLWYLFNFRQQSTGRTALEETLRKYRDRLSPEVVEMLEAWRDSRYGLFEVVAVDRNIELKDVFAGDTISVTATVPSDDMQPGDYFLTRLEAPGGRVALSGDELRVQRWLLPKLRKFIESEIKNTGQTPAEYVQANIHSLHRKVKEL